MTPLARPGPPPGANNFVVVILDSLRYDSWIDAQPQSLARLGSVERRWSYASWTAPSHYNLLMGLRGKAGIALELLRRGELRALLARARPPGNRD